MVPQLLRVRNFMSYGDEPVEVDFAGLHLACLSGGNGHGKSALLDAMTWALWGRSRARREDDLVYQGAREMEVELHFVVGGQRYRVIRKRTLRASGGTAALELQQAAGDGGYTSITGGTIHETQAYLTSHILKLGYETFVNSTFLLQGRADAFTVKTPTERKAVLGEILGLGEYDHLSEKARQRARDLAAKASSMREEIARDTGELAVTATLQEELAEKRRQHDDAIAECGVTETLLDEVVEQLRHLEADHKALEGLRRSIVAQRENIEMLEGRGAEARRSQAQAEELLQQQPAIMAEQAEREQVRFELDALDERQERANEARQDVVTQQHEIALAKAGLERDGATALAEADRLAREAAQAPALRRKVEELEQAQASLPSLESEQVEARQRQQTMQAEMAALTGENERLEKEMGPLRERLHLLQERGAACPVCGASMSEAERVRVMEQFTAEGVTKRRQVETNKGSLTTLIAEVKQAKQHEDQLAARLAALRKQAGELAALRQRLEAVERVAVEEVAARARAETARQAVDSQNFAHEARVRLAAAQEALAAIGYDAERHRALRDRAKELEGVEARLTELATARERYDNARSTIARTEEDLRRGQEELGQTEESAARLSASLAVLPMLEQRRAEREEDVKEARHRRDGLSQHIAVLSERLRWLGEQEERLRGQRDKLASLDREQGIYAELGDVFGKKGIQAMLIDGALPELERGANAILARMSDNGMQVQFATQSQGSKGDLLETLDIKIADASGTRPYEMFSGGEAFRVNFAIRVALSRLLAERAGAQLQMLVIDEGFGTQDSEGRDRLVGAITSIADDFEKIIVITHIDELKDLFSTRIDVVKGLNGSRVTVTAA